MKSFVGQAGGNNFAAHGVRQRNIRADVEAQPHVGPLRGTGAARVHHVQFCAVAQPLQQVVEENRVRLPRVRSPQQNHIRLFNLAIRAGAAPRSEYRRQTGDARGVSSAVAAIDVVAAASRCGQISARCSSARWWSWSN